VDLGNPLYIR